MNKSKVLSVFLLVLLFSSVFVSFINIPVSYAFNTVYFTPVDDAFVHEASPDTAYGTTTTLDERNRTMPAGSIITLLNFNVSALPQNIQPVTATLSLYTFSSNGAGNRTIDIFRLNETDTWDESTVIWNSIPSKYSDVKVSHSISAAVPFWWNVSVLDVTVLDEDLLGFWLCDDTEEVNGFLKIWSSKENGYYPTPVLTIVYTYTDPTNLGITVSNADACGYDDYDTPLNSSDLVILMHMDEGSGLDLADDSGNNNDGNLTGDFDEWFNRRLSPALEFENNTDDYIEISHDATLNLNDTWTNEVWFKTSSGYNDYAQLLEKTGTSAGAFSWHTPTAIEDFCHEVSGDAIDSIDDNTATDWKCGTLHSSPPYQWIEYDLGASVIVTKIRIYQMDVASHRFGQNYGLWVFVSDDPDVWGDIVWFGTLDATGWQETDLFSATGRYVKLLSNSVGFNQRIFEFDAYYGVEATITNYDMHVDEGLLAARIYDGTNEDEIFSTNTINDTRWHHALSTWDRNGNFSLYLDGNLENTIVTTITDSVINSANIVLAVDQGLAMQFLEGCLDEYRLYDRVLNSTEITWSYVHGEEWYDKWVFAENNEKYYSFEGRYAPELTLDTMMMSFTDGRNFVNASYDASTGGFTLIEGEEVAFLGGCEYSATDQEVTINWGLYLKEGILDAYQIDIYQWCNDTEGVETDWELKSPNHFSIYNLGGLKQGDDDGDAGNTQIPTSAWDWKTGDTASTENWIQVNQTFRNLQHYRWLTSIWVNAPLGSTAKGTGYAEYGFFVCSRENHIYKRVFKVRINATDWDLGWGGNSIELNVKWYNGTDQLVSETNIYSYYETSDALNLTRFVVDLWVDIENGSTILGGHVNPVYYDKENWFGGGTGGRYISQFHTDLTDIDESVISIKDTCMMKAYMILYKNTDATEGVYWTTQETQYNVLDGTPDGVDHPLFLEPKIFTESGWGFFEPLRQSILFIGSAIVKAATIGVLAFWTIFVKFLDTVAAFLGYPYAFTNFIGYLGDFWSWMVIAFTSLVSLITPLFTIFSTFLLGAIGLLVIFITAFIDVWTTGVNLVTGGYDFVAEFWVAYNVTTFITIGAILYPFYLAAIFKEKGMTGLLLHLQVIYSAIAFVFNIFMGIINLVIRLFTAIIESIPVVE